MSDDAITFTKPLFVSEKLAILERENKDLKKKNIVVAVVLASGRSFALKLYMVPAALDVKESTSRKLLIRTLNCVKEVFLKHNWQIKRQKSGGKTVYNWKKTSWRLVCPRAKKFKRTANKILRIIADM